MKKSKLSVSLIVLSIYVLAALSCDSMNGLGNQTYYNPYTTVVPSSSGGPSNSGGTSYSGGSSSTNNSTTTYTQTCQRCMGDGKCATCNGKGWFNSPYGTGKVTCPNCESNHNGVCSWCHGTGKKK